MDQTSSRQSFDSLTPLPCSVVNVNTVESSSLSKMDHFYSVITVVKCDCSASQLK